MSEDLTKLLLIRHCESSGQAPDAPLTEAGERAAQALAERLVELAPDALYSSPYRRARSTIAPFAHKAGLPVTVDQRLRERVLSEAPLDDWLEHICRSFADADHRAHASGETLREVEARGSAALADIAGAGHRLAVAVSHGALISAILRVARPDFGFDAWRSLRNPDLFEVSLQHGRPIEIRRIE